MSMQVPNGGTVTCMACRLVLVGADARLNHYRTDFHRVNLQRKVAGVPPLSEDDYKVRAQAAEDESQAAAGRRAPRFCSVCSKKFSSESALTNHVASRRHRDAVRARAPHMSLEAAAIGPITKAPIDGSAAPMMSPADSEDEAFEQEMDMERRIAEAVPFASTECVFDGRVCEDEEENLKHMSSFGFFLPFAESVSDVTSLLEYFGQKVGIGYACVECDRAFTSVNAVQRHMVDRQHCRMTADEAVWFEEYGQFYAFGGVAFGDNDDDDWEEVEDDEEAAAVDAILTAKGGATGQVVATLDSQLAGEVAAAKQTDDAPEEEVAMVLGNKTIGHRSLRRYYKQRLHSSDTREAVVINKLSSEYRVMGWQGKKMPDATMKNKRMQAFKHCKRNLAVGMKNYYTRKAPLHVSFSALNSGYVSFEQSVRGWGQSITVCLSQRNHVLTNSFSFYVYIGIDALCFFWRCSTSVEAVEIVNYLL